MGLFFDPRCKIFRICAGVLLTILTGTPGSDAAEPNASSNSAAQDPFAITLPRVPRPPTVADFMDMQAPADLAHMARVTGFVQRSPLDGSAASQPTIVLAGFDRNNLHLVFLAFDDEPERIRARMSRRELIADDDQVTVLLDTFHDRQRAFAFRANPFGIQWDATWNEGQGYDSSFDTIWRSTGALTGQGYVVVMTLPFKSLRFAPPDAGGGSPQWGFIFTRSVPRGQGEFTTWPHISSRVEGWLNQGGTLSGLDSISPSRNQQVIPYGSFRSFKLLDEDHPVAPRVIRDSSDATGGLDFKSVIKDRLVADVTVNPDFSQIESDSPQVTVNQRFEVFFPERRPFFLENADLFGTPLTLLFTRRIADPQLGGRLTGKLGDFGLGALLIDDDAPGAVASPGEPGAGETARFGVARLYRDLRNQSRLGFMYVGREFDRRRNQVLGVDSRVKYNDRWVSNLHLVGSDTDRTDGTRGNGTALFADISRSGRVFNTAASLTAISPRFEADSGFIPRNDMIRLSTFSSLWRWADNQDKRLINWGPELFTREIWDHDGNALDSYFEPSLEWQWPGQTFFEVNAGYGHITLQPADFPALPGKTRFDVSTWLLEYGTAFWQPFRIRGNLRWGKEVNFNPPAGLPPAEADLLQTDLSTTLWTGRRLRVDGTLFFTRLEDPATGGKIFDDWIGRTRWNLQFNRNWSLRVILQYEDNDPDPRFSSLDRRRNLNTDLLVTYLVNPWTAVHVGYNDNLRNVELVEPGGGPPTVRPRNGLRSDGRQVFAKISYLFRF